MVLRWGGRAALMCLSVAQLVGALERAPPDARSLLFSSIEKPDGTSLTAQKAAALEKDDDPSNVFLVTKQKGAKEAAATPADEPAAEPAAEEPAAAPPADAEGS